MTDEERKAWVELVQDAKDDPEIWTALDAGILILAADAELKRLREAVAEIKRELFDLKINRALAVIGRLHLKE